MTDTSSDVDGRETRAVLVRYWASARAAAGVDSERVAVDGPVSLADLVDRLVRGHEEPALARVLGICSVLVGDRPVSTEDPHTVVVGPGDSVEFLPPFAGG